MNILVSFNDGYAIPTKVMLKSLIYNNPDKIDVYVLYCNLSRESIDTINDLKSVNVTFHFLQVNSMDFKSLPLTQHFTQEVYIKLFAYEYFDKDIDRILWLDGDTIINGSIKEFYNQDFEGKWYIASPDYYLHKDPIRFEKLGLDNEREYINAGVLLMNVAKLRDEFRKELVLKYIDLHFSKLDFLEQDVINGCFCDKIKVIDANTRYNFFTRRIYFYNERKAIKENIIFHYVTGNKPWKKRYPYGAFDLWWKYAKMISDKKLNSEYQSIKKSRNRDYLYEVFLLFRSTLRCVPHNTRMYKLFKKMDLRIKKKHMGK